MFDSEQLAGFAGASGVAIGAFGAHALKETLAKTGRTTVYQTGVQYHLIHAAALLALSLRREKKEVDFAAQCFAAGIVLFSGSLYGLALGGPRWLGPVTPLGGTLFIVGWASLAFGGSRSL
jgi:uncharacterized membrane protein YgdD (TMEM256/DUF423 family)